MRHRRWLSDTSCRAHLKGGLWFVSCDCWACETHAPYATKRPSGTFPVVLFLFVPCVPASRPLYLDPWPSPRDPRPSPQGETSYKSSTSFDERLVSFLMLSHISYRQFQPTDYHPFFKMRACEIKFSTGGVSGECGGENGWIRLASLQLQFSELVKSTLYNLSRATIPTSYNNTFPLFSLVHRSRVRR